MCPSPRTARVTVAAVSFVSGAGFATWAARIPAGRERLDLSPGELGVAQLTDLRPALAAVAVPTAVMAGLARHLHRGDRPSVTP